MPMEANPRCTDRRSWAQLITNCLTCVSAVSLSKKRATSDLKRSGSGHDCSSPAGGRAGKQRDLRQELNHALQSSQG